MKLHIVTNEKDLTNVPRDAEDIRCLDGQLESLEGCPESALEVYANGCKIKTLKGCGQHVITLHVARNYLRDLKHLPDSVLYLHCQENYIQDFSILHKNIQTLTSFGNPGIDTIDLPELTALTIDGKTYGYFSEN